jgi:purine-nucleoside/S-methyl-5'-thioadenosine phosphorylase / adenosine deaminase
MTSDIQSPPATAFRAVGALRLLTWPAIAGAAVTTRSGGVSSGPYATLNLSLSVGDDPGRVLENRRRLAAALGASPGDFVFARQVHGAGVRVVGDADRGSGAFSPDDAVGAADEAGRAGGADDAGRAGAAGGDGRAGAAGGADALVTTAPGVLLTILTADCVPIVLHDPAAGVLACVHAGWRGTVAGVTAAAVAAMQDLGARPSGIVAGLGPAAAPGRYQVGPDVHQAVTRSFGPAAPAFIRPDPTTPDRWLLNLWAANRHSLLQAGVPAPQIHTTTHPTGPAGFFSDRAERPCGRLALVARLRTGGTR